MAKIRQDKDGWDPLSVPLRKAENGTRGLDSLGSDGGTESRYCARLMPVLNLTQSLKQAYKLSRWK